jgi:GntR family transcriptional repressor for pyruvate dehydrogenase complex
MPLKPIKQGIISEQIFEQIKGNIARGEWPPGTKLPSENELTQMFSVSRVPIREALRKLSALGIVEIRRGEGTYVSSITMGTFMNALMPILILNKKNMMDILQYRELVEGESAAIAAQNASLEDIRLLENTVETMVKIGRPCLEFSEADLQFHMQVAQATQNSLIAGIANIIHDILVLYYQKINEIMGIERAIYYHTLVFNAIRDRDVDGARKWMNEHIKTTVESIAQSFPEKTK